MNNQIRKRFDQAIATYKKAAVIQKKVAAGCCSHIPEKTYSRVLEIGAGGGLLTEYFLQKHKDFEMYAALDISLMMLSLVPRGLVVPVQADGENAPFKQNCFDLLISSSAMQWYQGGTAPVLKNISLLRKGGHFSLAIFVQGTFKEMAGVSARTGFGSLYSLHPAKDLKDCFDFAGLSFESALEVYTEYFPSVKDLLQSHKQTGATYTRSGALFGRRAYKDFCRTYEHMFGEKDGIPATYKVLYLWGQRTRIRDLASDLCV